MHLPGERPRQESGHQRPTRRRRIRVSSRGQGATRRPEGSRGPRGKPGVGKRSTDSRCRRRGTGPVHPSKRRASLNSWGRRRRRFGRRTLLAVVAPPRGKGSPPREGPASPTDSAARAGASGSSVSAVAPRQTPSARAAGRAEGRRRGPLGGASYGGGVASSALSERRAGGRRRARAHGPPVGGSVGASGARRRGASVVAHQREQIG